MRATLTKSVVDKLPVGIVWDKKITGFGARRQHPEGGVHYLVKKDGRWFGLGRHGHLTLEQARTAAQKLLGQLASGEDPRPASTGTFGEAATLYLSRRKAALRPKTFHDIERYLMTLAQPLHRFELHEVNRRAIAELLAKIEQASGPVARNRVRSSFSAFFSWAIREGLLDTNPVAGTGKAEERSRERVLSPAELGKLWTTLVSGSHVHFVEIVRLLLLTGQRREEIAGLRWSEVDFDARVLRLPPERTKNKRPHIVPLSDPALEILRIRFQDRAAGQENDARVFVGFSWSIEKARFDRGLGIAGWRIHDIRRSVATHMADQLGVLPHIVEAVLNHVSGHKAGVAGTYNRAKYEAEMRAALDRWAEWIESNARSALL
jgi:integrase